MVSLERSFSKANVLGWLQYQNNYLRQFCLVLVLLKWPWTLLFEGHCDLPVRIHFEGSVADQGLRWVCGRVWRDRISTAGGLVVWVKQQTQFFVKSGRQIAQQSVCKQRIIFQNACKKPGTLHIKGRVPDPSGVGAVDILMLKVWGSNLAPSKNTTYILYPKALVAPRGAGRTAGSMNWVKEAGSSQGSLNEVWVL